LDARSYAIRKIRPAELCVLTILLAVPAIAGGSARDSAVVPPVELRLPADVVYRHGNASDSAVIFSHQTHVALERTRCTGCHPRLFPMLKRGPVPAHREMGAGRSCGLCHDGRKAFGVRDSASCRACHSGTRPPRMAAGGASGTLAGPAAGRRMPGPYAYPTGGDSPGRVTFRHDRHLRGTGNCASCHPKPFRMAAAPPRSGGGMHERSACGACHDGKTAFAAEDPDACPRCHAEAGARP
jgi:c(7)-type cytochrome triheme protein